MRTSAVLVTAALLALSGCSGSDSGTDSSPAATESAASIAPSAPASPVASIPAPVMVEPGQSDVEATVGQAIVFDVGAKPGRWEITTDDPEVLQVVPGGKDGDATFNPGAQALSPGTATVTMTDAQGELDDQEYTVTVTQ
jgi:hypothetical protein